MFSLWKDRHEKEIVGSSWRFGSRSLSVAKLEEEHVGVVAQKEAEDMAGLFGPVPMHLKLQRPHHG